LLDAFVIEHAFVTLSNICSLSSHHEHMFGGELLFD
jgi:hypothetical protein